MESIAMMSPRTEWSWNNANLSNAFKQLDSVSSTYKASYFEIDEIHAIDD